MTDPIAPETALTLATSTLVEYGCHLETNPRDWDHPEYPDVLLRGLLSGLMCWADRWGVNFTQALDTTPTRPTSAHPTLPLGRWPLPRPGAAPAGSRPEPADHQFRTDQHADIARAVLAYHQRSAQHTSGYLPHSGGVAPTLIALLGDLRQFAEHRSISFDTALQYAQSGFMTRCAAEGIGRHVGDLVRIRDATRPGPHRLDFTGHPLAGWVIAVYPDYTGDRKYAVAFAGEPYPAPYSISEIEPAPPFPIVETGHGPVTTPGDAERALIALSTEGTQPATARDGRELAESLLEWGGGSAEHLRAGVTLQAGRFRAARAAPLTVTESELPRTLNGAAAALRSMASARRTAAKPPRPRSRP